MLRTSSIVYLVVLSTIVLFILLYGNNKISYISKDRSARILYSVIVIAIYIAFLGIHFMNWTLENIFIMILIVSVLLSIIGFLLIYFSKSICAERKSKINYVGYLIIFLAFIVIYLAFFDRTNYTSFTNYDAARFISILIIIRIMYYLVKKYNKPLFKTITDVSLVLSLFLFGIRFYEIQKNQ